MKQILTLLTVFLLGVSVYAQQRTVTGVVTAAEDGEPLI